MSDTPVRKIVTRSVVQPTYTEEKSAEDRLYEFAEEQIGRMKKYSNLGDPNGLPGFEELNRALMGYSETLYSLQAMDVVAKQEAYHATEEFKDFLAEKYMEARNILNPPTIAAAKWYSSSELESYVRVHWHDEYKRLNDEQQAANSKVAFIRRLLDAWDSYKFNLNTLSKNVQTEAMQLMGNQSNF